MRWGVANDNATHWKNALGVQQARNKTLRTDLRMAQDLLRRANDIIGPGRGDLRPRNTNMDRCLDDLQRDITKHLSEA